MSMDRVTVTLDNLQFWESYNPTVGNGQRFEVNIPSFQVRLSGLETDPLNPTNYNVHLTFEMIGSHPFKYIGNYEWVPDEERSFDVLPVLQLLPHSHGQQPGHLLEHATITFRQIWMTTNDRKRKNADKVFIVKSKCKYIPVIHVSKGEETKKFRFETVQIFVNDPFGQWDREVPIRRKRRRRNDDAEEEDLNDPSEPSTNSSHDANQIGSQRSGPLAALDPDSSLVRPPRPSVIQQAPSISALPPPRQWTPIPPTHLSLKRLNRDLWDRWQPQPMEMLCQRVTNKMHPPLQFQIMGLNEDFLKPSFYDFYLSFEMIGNHRFKYSEENGWVPDEETRFERVDPLPRYHYLGKRLHGYRFREKILDFSCVRITADEGLVTSDNVFLLTPMCKYVPIVQIFEEEKLLKEFRVEKNQFIAVSIYNQQVTPEWKLEIQEEIFERNRIRKLLRPPHAEDPDNPRPPDPTTAWIDSLRNDQEGSQGQPRKTIKPTSQSPRTLGFNMMGYLNEIGITPQTVRERTPLLFTQHGKMMPTTSSSKFSHDSNSKFVATNPPNANLELSQQPGTSTSIAPNPGIVDPPQASVPQTSSVVNVSTENMMPSTSCSKFSHDPRSNSVATNPGIPVSIMNSGITANLELREQFGTSTMVAENPSPLRSASEESTSSPFSPLSPMCRLSTENLEPPEQSGSSARASSSALEDPSASNLSTVSQGLNSSGLSSNLELSQQPGTSTMVTPNPGVVDPPQASVPLPPSALNVTTVSQGLTMSTNLRRPQQPGTSTTVSQNPFPPYSASQISTTSVFSQRSIMCRLSVVPQNPLPPSASNLPRLPKKVRFAEQLETSTSPPQDPGIADPLQSSIRQAPSAANVSAALTPSNANLELPAQSGTSTLVPQIPSQQPSASQTTLASLFSRLSAMSGLSTNVRRPPQPEKSTIVARNPEVVDPPQASASLAPSKKGPQNPLVPISYVTSSSAGLPQQSGMVPPNRSPLRSASQAPTASLFSRLSVMSGLSTSLELHQQPRTAVVPQNPLPPSSVPQAPSTSVSQATPLASLFSRLSAVSGLSTSLEPSQQPGTSAVVPQNPLPPSSVPQAPPLASLFSRLSAMSGLSTSLKPPPQPCTSATSASHASSDSNSSRLSMSPGLSQQPETSANVAKNPGVVNSSKASVPQAPTASNFSTVSQVLNTSTTRKPTSTAPTSLGVDMPEYLEQRTAISRHETTMPMTSSPNFGHDSGSSPSDAPTSSLFSELSAMYGLSANLEPPQQPGTSAVVSSSVSQDPTASNISNISQGSTKSGLSTNQQPGPSAIVPENPLLPAQPAASNHLSLPPNFDYSRWQPNLGLLFEQLQLSSVLTTEPQELGIPHQQLSASSTLPPVIQGSNLSGSTVPVTPQAFTDSGFPLGFSAFPTFQPLPPAAPLQESSPSTIVPQNPSSSSSGPHAPSASNIPTLPPRFHLPGLAMYYELFRQLGTSTVVPSSASHAPSASNFSTASQGLNSSRLSTNLELSQRPGTSTVVPQNSLPVTSQAYTASGFPLGFSAFPTFQPLNPPPATPGSENPSLPYPGFPALGPILNNPNLYVNTNIQPPENPNDASGSDTPTFLNL